MFANPWLGKQYSFYNFFSFVFVILDAMSPTQS